MRRSPLLACGTDPKRVHLANRKPLSRMNALKIADDISNYNLRHTHDLLRVQNYLTHLSAALAEEIRNRYDRGTLVI